MSESKDVIDLGEVRKQADEALLTLCAERREKLRTARFARQMGQLPRTHVLKQLRRDIARIETVLAGRRQNEAKE